MSFGARLKEERRRLGHTQAGFAALAGTNAAKQSLYERGERQLRAAYLARLGPLGVDLGYVITGRRSGAAPLDDRAAAFLAAWLSLPAAHRGTVQRFLTGLSRSLEQERIADE